MLEIIVTVPPTRERAAGLRIVDDSRTIVDDWAVATAHPAMAKRANNAPADPLRPGGHPPLGRYELTARGPAPQSTEVEYGSSLLLFEPVSGQALDAESYGRLALLVYAGHMAPDSRLRRTQGGLRLRTMAMDMLLARMDDATPVELRIELATKPPWWAFWRKPREHPSLSDRPPQFDAPPLDEASLMSELMKRSQRRIRPQRDDDEWERRREGESSRESRSSSNDTQEFRGRGGEGGGGGASGEWSNAPAAGREPGVDAAGRIVTAVGVAAVATAAAIAAREASAGEHSASESDGVATGSAGASSSGEASESSQPSSDSGGDSGWSTTSTAY